MRLRLRLLPEEHPPVILLPLLLAAALAGNLFPFQFLLNIHVIFGSIFAFVALQLFGLPAGFLVGALAAGCTYVLWHQPYTMIVLMLEVAFAGCLYRR